MMRKTAAALLALTVLCAFPARADITGKARVIDGDTIEIDGRRIRLHGIDAPEKGQICHTRRKGNPYDCGVAAAERLIVLIAGQSLTCKDEARDGEGRLIAVCSIGRYDIGEQMVLKGWALADPEHGGKYRQAELAARKMKDGLWKGKFTPPWEWRQKPRD